MIELSSRKTWREDMYEKWQIYSRLGVREYFLFDPLYEYLPDPLMAWRLIDGQYILSTVENRRVLSEALGLELVDTGETLRLVDPKTGEMLPTEVEEIAARETAETRAAAAETRAAAAEARARKESNARQQVEGEMKKLRAELARVKRKPSKKRSS